jgi:hypothetical protein
LKIQRSPNLGAKNYSALKMSTKMSSKGNIEKLDLKLNMREMLSRYIRKSQIDNEYGNEDDNILDESPLSGQLLDK